MVGIGAHQHHGGQGQTIPNHWRSVSVDPPERSNTTGRAAAVTPEIGATIVIEPAARVE